MNGCNSTNTSESLLNAMFDELVFAQDYEQIIDTLKETLDNILKEAAPDTISEVCKLAEDKAAELAQAMPGSVLSLALARVPNFLNPDKIAPEKIFTKKEESSEETVNLEKSERKAAVARQIYHKYFQGAARPQLYFRRFLNGQFIRSCFIDRASHKVISDNQELNELLLSLKLELIDTLYEYLTTGVDIVVNGKPDIRQDPRQVRAFLEKITPVFTSESFTERSLNAYYKQYKNTNDLICKNILDAYNAFVLLSNFDFFLKDTLGDIVEIDRNDYGRFTSSTTTYSFSSKAINMWGNLYGDDVSDLGDIISTVSLHLVKSLHRYTWKSNEAMPDQYLQFSDFNTIIGKIKAIPGLARKNTFDLSFASNISGVSEDTRHIIELVAERKVNINGDEYEVYLSDLIASIDSNPMQVLPAIFDILCNTDIINTLDLDVYGNPLITQYDKNIIWSLNKELFGSDPNSIASISYEQQKTVVYETLTLTADSIYAEDYLQYYMDSQNHIRTRNLKSFAVNQAERGLINTININSLLVSPENFDLKLGKFIINSDIVGKTIKTITVSVSGLSYTVTRDTVNRIPSPASTSYEDIWESSEFREFIFNTLGINLSLDEDLVSAYRDSFSGNNKYLMMVDDLMNLASRVLFNHAFNNLILPQYGDKTVSTLKSAIKQQFPDELFAPKPMSSEFKANVCTASYSSSLYHFALAKCINNGLLSASSVRTAEDTQLANFVTSRLANSIHHQLWRQNKTRNSATKYMNFVNNDNGFFLNRVTRREYKGDEDSKNVTDFTSAESFQTTFLYDFITAFSNKKSTQYDVFLPGIAGFIPTVNSDKAQQFLQAVNLHANARFTPGKAYSELTLEELEQEICGELFPVYDRMLGNISEDFRRILEYAGRSVSLNSANSLQNVATCYQAVNTAAREEGITPVQWLKEHVAAYNRTHSKTPIALGELTHYCVRDGKIVFNHSLVALWGRFNLNLDPTQSEQIRRLYKEEDILRGAYRILGFFQLKDRETILDLFNSKFSITLTGGNIDMDTPELSYLRNYPGGWITNDGKMVIAKAFNPKTQSWEILNNAFEYRQAIRAGLELLLHPMLAKYNRLDYLVSLQYELATVGSHVIHGKNIDGDVLLEEAKRLLASNKRNNALTATVHKYLANMLTGAPNAYRIAIIEDINVDVYNMMGIQTTHKALDGGLFANGFTAQLENNSLGSERAGQDKKLFGTFYLERNAAGGQIKTAEFACTNARMRDYPRWAILLQNMSDRKWIKKELADSGQDIPEEIDLTRWLGLGNTFNNVYYNRLGEDGKYYPMKFEELVKADEPNTYYIKESRVDRQGNFIEEVSPSRKVVIDTNWKLFTEVFGGHHSLSIQGRQLEFSEASMRFMAECINTIGYGYDQTGAIDYDVHHFRNLDEFYQPLKYSDINYCANEGAIKSAYTNINSNTALTKLSDLDFFVIPTAQIGILLDKEHTVDEARVSMPTLITSACANRGFVLDNTTQLYQALRGLTETVLEPWVPGINALLTDGDSEGILITNIINTVAAELSLEANDNGSLLTALQPFIELFLKNGKITREDILKNKIPWSEGSIYSQIYSKLSSKLNKTGIRLNMSGSLSVICPTEGEIQLYGDLKYGSLERIDPGGTLPPDVILQNLQEEIRNGDNHKYDKYRIYRGQDEDFYKNPVALRDTISLVRMQHNYVIEYADGTRHTIKLNTKRDYDNLLSLAIRPMQHPVRRLATEALYYSVEDGQIILPELSDYYPEGIRIDLLENTDQILGVVLKNMLSLNPGFVHQLTSTLVSNPKLADAFLYSYIEHAVDLGLVDVINDRVEYEELSNEEYVALQGMIQDAIIGAYNSIAITQIYEDVTQPRELAVYDCKFDAAIKVQGLRSKFCLFDLDSVQQLYDLEEHGFRSEHPIDRMYIIEHPYLSTLLRSTENTLGIIDYLRLKYKINIDGLKGFKLMAMEGFDAPMRNASNLLQHIRVAPEIAAQIRSYDDFRILIQQSYPGIDFDSIIEDPFSNEAKFNIIKKVCRSVLYKEFQKDLFALSEEYLGPRRVRIGGENITIDPRSIDIRPYELIMSKVDAKKFGLTETDDLLEILDDPDWFTKRTLRKLQTSQLAPEYFTYELKRNDGNHVYILSEEQFNAMNPVQKNIVTSYDKTFLLGVDDRIEHVDAEGNPVYELSSASDKVYNISGIDVIVTKNPQHFLDKILYDFLFLSDTISNLEIENLKLGDLSNPLAKKVLDDIIDLDFLGIKDYFRAFNELNLEALNADIKSLDSNLRKWVKTIKANGQETHASFEHSLKMIAGRTPAQSLQSFMIQKVVGFDNSNINSAYVCTALLWLLGSDLDIDAVTLIGSEFSSSGKYITWSPYFRMQSSKLLDASLLLPYPTGSEIKPIIKKTNWFTQYASYIHIPYREFIDALGNAHKQLDTEIHPDAPLEVTEDGKSFKVRTRTPEQIMSLARLLKRINQEGIGENISEAVEGLDMDQVHRQEIIGEFSQTAPTWLKEAIKPENLEALRNSLIELVNRHNTFLLKKSTSYLKAALQNLALYRMYKTAESPSNLAEGTESIDYSTRPLKEAAAKSELAKLDNKAAPGSAWSKHSQFVQGQVGKSCVGIGAVAIKINSATQYYFDVTINGNNEEDKVRLLIPENRLPAINGKLFRAIANLYDKSSEQTGTSQLLNPELKALIDELQHDIGFEEDVAINLAAFLSIAVDNAKDLALAKLNAKPLMLGLYDYGVSLGVPVAELENIINSRAGNIISRYAESNFLEGDTGQGKALLAIQIFEGKINSILKSFNMGIWSPGRVADRKIDTITDVLMALTDGYTKTSSLEERIYYLAKDGRLVDIITKDEGGILKQVVDICNYSYQELSRNSVLDINRRYAPENFRTALYSLLQWCIQYLQDLRAIEVGTLRDLRTLAEGAEEMRILGRYLSSNTGMATKDVDALKFTSLLENCILDRIHCMPANQLKGLQDPIATQYDLPGCKINFIRFFYDQDYQENCINAYDKVKHTTNILAVIAKVPHFTGYMRTAAVPYAAISAASSRFRAKIKYGSDEHIKEVFGNYVTPAIKESVKRNLDTLINMKYLIGALAAALVTFTIPKGLMMFNSRLEKVPSLGQPIALYTEEGLATFKMFMETYVIPRLQNEPSLKNNLFIQGLTPIELTRTMSRESAIVYSMAGTLLPHSDSEQALFDEYRADLNLLQNEDYFLLLDIPQGTQPNQINTLKDAFYIYTQYCFGGKKGPRSLLSLFDGDSPAALWSKGLLMDYISEFDANMDIVITKEEFIAYCAPTLSKYSTQSQYAYIRNDNNFQVTLSLKLSPEDYENSGFEGGFDLESFEGNWEAYLGYTGNIERLVYARAISEIAWANLVSSGERALYFIYPNVSKELPNYEFELQIAESLPPIKYTLNPKTGHIEYNLSAMADAVRISLDYMCKPLYSKNEKRNQKLKDLILLGTRKIVDTIRLKPDFMVAPRVSESGQIRQCVVPATFRDMITQEAEQISCSL